MDQKILIGLIGIITIGMVFGGYLLLKDKEAERISFEEPEKPTKLEPKEGMKKILIVHSYHPQWGWNQDTEKGVIEGLERTNYILNKDYTLEKFYMDTKNTYTTPDQIEMMAEEAMKIIGEYKPDVVIVNDDNALKYVAVAYTLENPGEELPFVFSGINADPTIYDPIDSLENPGHTITGALERFPYYQSFSLAKRIFPDKGRIVLLADSSPSSTFLVDAFNERYLEKVDDSPLEVVGVIRVETFKGWKAAVEEYQNKSDFLGIMTYHQLRDEEGNVVPASEVMLWTINRNKLPEIGFLLFHAEDGFWSAVGVSPYKTGRYVGTITGDILDGKDPGDIPITDPQLLDLAFNLERSEMLGIEIPIDILGMATEVYPEIKRPRY